MSGRKNFNRHEQQKKSNHFLGPEPVLMVRSGSRQQPAGSNSSALALIDELIEERTAAPSQEAVPAVVEEGGRRVSRRGSQASLSDRRGSVSRERLSTRSRTSSQDRLGQERVPPYIAPYQSSEQDDDHHYYQQQQQQRTGYLSAQERQQAFEHEQRRSRRPTAPSQNEDDWELRKRAKKVWGRSPYHPKTILQGTWDYVSSRRVLLIALGAILAAVLLVGGLVTFFVWPRAVSIRFLDIDHDQNPEPYRLVPKEQGVHLRVHSWVNVEVHNPNFFEARIKKSSVIANWVMFDGRKDMFGGSIIDEERTLKKREKYRLRLPITIEYMGSPKEDPIYGDFLERCYDGYGDGNIYLNFQIEVTTLAKDIERTGILMVDRSMACPMGKDQIKKALDALYGSQQEGLSPKQPTQRKR